MNIKEVKTIEDLDRDKLLEIIDNFAKNWLAMDGLWFQAVEKKFGMDEAMTHDEDVWRAFTVIEAKRIKKLLELPNNAGLEGLKKALRFRLYAPLNEDEITVEGNKLIYKVNTCRVQHARERKGMEFHPCKSVGEIEYAGFAKTIDERFETKCISCYPNITDKNSSCIWEFTLKE